MRKLFLLLFTTQISIAQVSTLPTSIGIGTGTLSTIPLHINSVGEVARFQGTTPYVSFYDNALLNGYIQAINNSFEIGSKNNYTITFYTGDTQRLKIYGDGSGITAYTRINAGAGLDLVGSLRVGDNAGTLGDVLMSLGNGTPVWSSISQNPQVGFQASLFPVGGYEVPNASETFLNNFNEQFDDGSNFDKVTGVFTAPSSGLYAFDIDIKIPNLTSSPNIPGYIRLYRNDIISQQRNFIISTSSSYGNGVETSFRLKLQQNDTVKFSFFQASGSNIDIGDNGSLTTRTVTCYKIY
ncbi:C1q-like domain-containing protein [Emticicia fontis]